MTCLPEKLGSIVAHKAGKPQEGKDEAVIKIEKIMIVQENVVLLRF